MNVLLHLKRKTTERSKLASMVETLTARLASLDKELLAKKDEARKYLISIGGEEFLNQVKDHDCSQGGTRRVYDKNVGEAMAKALADTSKGKAITFAELMARLNKAFPFRKKGSGGYSEGTVYQWLCNRPFWQSEAKATLNMYIRCKQSPSDGRKNLYYLSSTPPPSRI